MEDVETSQSVRAEVPASNLALMESYEESLHGTTTPTRNNNLPSLESQYIPTGDEEMIPKVGMLFHSLEEGESFYRAYASWAGFDVRKRSDTKKYDVITWKRFVCSKEGRPLGTVMAVVVGAVGAGWR